MGIIDSTFYKLSCDPCEKEESGKVVEKGSNWGSSGWRSGATFVMFDTKWEGGDRVEPTLLLATCKKCGQLATVKSSNVGRII